MLNKRILSIGRIFIYTSATFLTLTILSCGKTSININEGKYEPKIVIHGYIYPNQPIRDIQIKRNYPIGVIIDKEQMHLRNAKVTLTDMQTDSVYNLVFNHDSLYFEYTSSVLRIGCLF